MKSAGASKVLDNNNPINQICSKPGMISGYFGKPTLKYLFENLSHWFNIAYKNRYAQTITDVPHRWEAPNEMQQMVQQSGAQGKDITFKTDHN